MILTLANRITIVRILLIAPFIMCMCRINDSDNGDTFRYIAIVIFLLMCISDALDGYMARVKKQVTRLGSFLDPMADKMLMTSACILLAYNPTAVEHFELPIEVAILIIGKDILLLLGFMVLFLMTIQVHVVPGVIGKFAAFLQLMMVAAILIAPEMSKLAPAWKYVCKTLWWGAAGTAILATLMYLNFGKKFIEQQATENKNGD